LFFYQDIRHLCDESIQFFFPSRWVVVADSQSFHMSRRRRRPLSVSVIGPYHGHHAWYIYTYMAHGDGTERARNFWWSDDGSVLFLAIRTNYSDPPYAIRRTLITMSPS
jgi:hypothetical protein